MISIRNFIEKLQNSEDNVKKRWLIILSGLSMVIIIAVWLIYFNNSIEKVGEKQLRQSETTFWQVFKTGLRITGNAIKGKSLDVIYKITGKKTIIIE